MSQELNPSTAHPSGTVMDPPPLPGGGWVLRHAPSHSGSRGVEWWGGPGPRDPEGQKWISVPATAIGQPWTVLPEPLAKVAVFATETEAIATYIQVRGEKPSGRMKPQRVTDAKLEWHQILGTNLVALLDEAERLGREATAAAGRAKKIRQQVDGLPENTYGGVTLYYTEPGLTDDSAAIKEAFPDGVPKKWTKAPLKLRRDTEVALPSARVSD